MNEWRESEPVRDGSQQPPVESREKAYALWDRERGKVSPSPLDQPAEISAIGDDDKTARADEDKTDRPLDLSRGKVGKHGFAGLEHGQSPRLAPPSILDTFSVGAVQTATDAPSVIGAKAQPADSPSGAPLAVPDDLQRQTGRGRRRDEEGQVDPEAFQGHKTDALSSSSGDRQTASASGMAVESAWEGFADTSIEQSEFIGSEIRTSVGSAFFYAPDTEFRDAAKDVPDYAGEYVIDVHGTDQSVELYDGDGYLRKLDAREFAQVVRTTAWSGEPVRLFSCETGRDPEGFAQRLADELGVPVNAPTGLVSSGHDMSGRPLPPLIENRMVSASPATGDLIESRLPGNWITFYPRRSIVL